jgi:hypothetical protein
MPEKTQNWVEQQSVPDYGLRTTAGANEWLMTGCSRCRNKSRPQRSSNVPRCRSSSRMGPRRFVRRHVYRGGNRVIEPTKQYGNRPQHHAVSAQPHRAGRRTKHRGRTITGTGSAAPSGFRGPLMWINLPTYGERSQGLRLYRIFTKPVSTSAPTTPRTTVPSDMYMAVLLLPDRSGT